MSDKIIGFGAALVLHSAVIAMLAISFHNPPAPRAVAAPPMEAVEAVAVDEALVRAELEKLRATEQTRRDTEAERQRQLADEAEQMRQAREQEAAQLAELKQKREHEQRERKVVEEAERRRIAELKAEQERIEKRRAEEQQRLAETEKQRKAEEDKKLRLEQARAKLEKEQRERELKAKLDAEAKALQQDRERRAAAQRTQFMAQYMADIRNKVERNWLRPAGTAGNVECKVLVTQLPGGEVVNVRLLQTCGSPALDRSVEAAVNKASPLPSPPTPEVFDREIQFHFKAR